MISLNLNKINNTISKINFKGAQTVPINNSLVRSPQTDSYTKTNPIANPNELNIYYYNDTHGNSDSMAGVCAAAKNFKEANKDKASFVLSAGDNYSGGDIAKNGFITDLMQNIMGVDASAVGNHEIDATSNGFFEAAAKKNISFVATNVDLDNDNPMNKFVKKSMILERGGVKYGFVGTMPSDFKTCSKESVQKGINVKSVDDTVVALQEEIDKLKAQGINRIIMLSHIGHEVDKEIVQKIDGIDVVIGGHSHTVVEGAVKGQNLLTSKSGEPVLVTQAGENGKYYGIATVKFDDNGVITEVSNNLHKSENTEKSPIIEYVKSKTIGDSPKVGVLKEADPLPPNRRIEPCGWTLTMADAVKSELGVEIALINSANIRKVPKNGTLTERDIQESAPMKNELFKTRITQKQLVESVQNAARQTLTNPDGYPGLIQGSGFSYIVDAKGNLLEMNIVDDKGNKTPVDIKNPSDEITYSAAYDTFMAQKGGETPELEPKFEQEMMGYDKDTAMVNYLSKRPDKDDLKIINDGRIQIQKT